MHCRPYTEYIPKPYMNPEVLGSASSSSCSKIIATVTRMYTCQNYFKNFG